MSMEPVYLDISLPNLALLHFVCHLVFSDVNYCLVVSNVCNLKKLYRFSSEKFKENYSFNSDFEN
jgi:hypothetical protein